MSELKPDDIFETYGAFNDLTIGDNDPIGDRQTLSATQALSGWLESFYTPDVLKGKSVYDGVIMATIATTSPILQSNQALIEYLSDPPDLVLYYIYKVYIPEVEPRCISFSDREGPVGEFTNAQRVMTLPNAIIDAKIPASENLRALAAGTYVQVIFANQQKLKNPKIIAIGKKVINLTKALNQKGSLKTEFGSSRGQSYGMGVYRTSANHHSSRNAGTTAEGCPVYKSKKSGGSSEQQESYLHLSTKSATPRVLALGASFAAGDATYAGSMNLDLDRIAKGSQVFAGGKKSILAHLKTNVEAGCIIAADYDSVIMFGGANGMRKDQYKRMKQVLEYVRDEMKIENRYVVTLHGWYGWRMKDKVLGDKSIQEAWTAPERVEFMGYTNDYNDWMRNAGKDSGLITDYLEWSNFATATNNVGPPPADDDDTTYSEGRIIPGSRDWFKKGLTSGDGLHPSHAGHRKLAEMLRAKRWPGFVT